MNDARLIPVLRRFASALRGDYDLAETLQHLGTEICGVLEVEGAGVMLEDSQGDLRFTAASDDRLEALEILQAELDEGPCLYAYRTGQRVVAADLTTDDRFPEFSPRAVEVGVRSVHSVPLRLDDGDTILGALNLFDTEPHPLDDPEVEVLDSLADVATSYVVNARTIQRAELLNRQLSEALDRRVAVEQAKGFLVARTGADLATAREALRGYARDHQARMRDVAAEVLDGRLPISELGLTDARR